MSQRIAFVFPGQGSQAVGMGADIVRVSPAANAVFEIADRALGFALSTLCFEGPEETLRETINTQPAIVATSLALLAALQAAASATESASAPNGAHADPALTMPFQPDFVAGHSVGEYAALAAAGALEIGATLRLVRERGRLMHEEGLRCPSGMAAVLGMDRDALATLCVEATEQTLADPEAQADAPHAHPGAGRVVVANDNAPGQVVISGEQRALERAMELARARGARRVVPLTVSGAFHSPVMSPAAAGLAQAVAQAPFTDALVPVISNITAQPLTRADDLRRELSAQIESPVEWTRSIEYLVAQGVQTFVEIGAGQVLAGLIKRIAKGATVLSVGVAADVPVAAERLRALTQTD